MKTNQDVQRKFTNRYVTEIDKSVTDDVGEKKI